MREKLVGVHKVKAKLADGSETTYFYAWRGGPRIKAKPGTMAFTQEFVRLSKGRPHQSADQTIGWLIDQYLASADYQKLRPSTRGDYERIVGAIRAEFGTMQLVAAAARGARTVFLDWRDTMRTAPKAAARLGNGPKNSPSSSTR